MEKKLLSRGALEGDRNDILVISLTLNFGSLNDLGYRSMRLPTIIELTWKQHLHRTVNQLRIAENNASQSKILNQTREMAHLKTIIVFFFLAQVRSTSSKGFMSRIIISPISGMPWSNSAGSWSHHWGARNRDYYREWPQKNGPRGNGGTLDISKNQTSGKGPRRDRTCPN